AIAVVYDHRSRVDLARLSAGRGASTRCANARSAATPIDLLCHQSLNAQRRTSDRWSFYATPVFARTCRSLNCAPLILNIKTQPPTPSQSLNTKHPPVRSKTRRGELGPTP